MAKIFNIQLVKCCLLLLLGIYLQQEVVAASPVIRDEFTLTPPDGYELYSEEDLQFFTEVARKEAPAIEMAPLILGMYRPATSDGEAFPYILITWVKKGVRISLSELRKFESIDVTSAIKKTGANVERTMGNAKIAQPRYDELRNIVWYETIDGFENHGSKMIAASLPTEVGMFQLVGYFPVQSQTFDADVLAFSSLVDSVKFPPGIAYHKSALPRENENITPKLIRQLIFLLGLLAAIRLKKSRQRRTDGKGRGEKQQEVLP